ncbi:hypothetical protein [Sphingomonas oryzagri]
MQTSRKGFWDHINSPVVVAILTGVIIAGGGKIYADRQADARELDTRRSAYAKLLTEYEHRVSDLGIADGCLDPELGEGPTLKGIKPIPKTGPARDRWTRLSLAVGKQESDILRGRGSYAPTDPAFEGMSFEAVAIQMETLGGVPDIQVGAMRLFGALDSGPDVVWLFVRSWLPMMRQVSVSRHMMFADGRLPFRRGHAPTEAEQKSLGFPDMKPGDLERLERQTDALHAQIQNM